MTQNADNIQAWLREDSEMEISTMINMEYFTTVLMSACACLMQVSTVVLKEVDTA